MWLLILLLGHSTSFAGFNEPIPIIQATSNHYSFVLTGFVSCHRAKASVASSAEIAGGVWFGKGCHSGASGWWDVGRVAVPLAWILVGGLKHLVLNFHSIDKWHQIKWLVDWLIFLDDMGWLITTDQLGLDFESIVLLISRHWVSKTLPPPLTLFGRWNSPKSGGHRRAGSP